MQGYRLLSRPNLLERPPCEGRDVAYLAGTLGGGTIPSSVASTILSQCRPDICREYSDYWVRTVTPNAASIESIGEKNDVSVAEHPAAVLAVCCP